MLSKEDLSSLLETEGEAVLEIKLNKCRVGDVFRAKNRRGYVYIIEVTVPISWRANVYTFFKDETGKENLLSGSYHFPEAVRAKESVTFGNFYTLGLVELQKVRSG
jgi:hypothetical protein